MLASSSSSTSDNNTNNAILERTKSKIFQLKAGWKEPVQLQRVFDQRRLLSLQAEELRMAKRELSAALELVARTSQELESEKQTSDARATEIRILHELVSEYDSKITSLNQENASLVNRILADKSRVADEVNEQNERLGGGET